MTCSTFASGTALWICICAAVSAREPALTGTAPSEKALVPVQLLEARAAGETAAEPATPSTSAGLLDAPFTPDAAFQGWVTDLVREHIPHEYEKRKNWGHTEKVLDGIFIQLEDGKLKTHRNFRDANDGRWQMYRLRLKNPDEKFQIRIEKMQELSDGRVAMELLVTTRLEVFGRRSLWQRGVQVYSISAEADATVSLSAQAEVAMRLDPTRLPPDVYIKPKIVTAKLQIQDFRLRRVSDFDGPVVRSLSASVQGILKEKLEEQNEELPAKLNKQIIEQEKNLKLSLADVISFRPESAPKELR